MTDRPIIRELPFYLIILLFTYYVNGDGLANKIKREEKGERKFVRSLHYIDDEEYLARHAEDLNPTVKAEDVPEAGTVTKAGEAPAPIKNDEKSSYKNKK